MLEAPFHANRWNGMRQRAQSHAPLLASLSC
jgi:hypothetical protein